MLRVAFIGAGQVNFGGGEGPWNHAKRLEELRSTLSVDVNVVAIYDPYTQHAEKVLERQRSISLHPSMWKETRVFGDYKSMFDSSPIDAVIIGVPPLAHGSSSPPQDIEMQCAARKIHMFVEKPISCHPVMDVKEVCSAVSKEQENGLVVSVGYMFRYSKAIQKMKEITNLYGHPRAVMLRYNCAYSKIAKEMWWDIKHSGGPIVEQATHFCDIARFIAGDIDLDTVKATCIRQTDQLGALRELPSNISVLEGTIPEERRIPRVTHAFWQFKNGAIGSLTHGVMLHGNKYESEIEVWGDGYRMVLSDPYTKCTLSLRLPGDERTEILEFSNEDVYYEEMKVFLDAIMTGSQDQITSPYEDAFKTYEFSWRIRNECEASLKK